MGYCLKLREPLADGLKRIFCEEIDAAVGLCRHPAKQRGVTVHEVRKHLKKLRAALRLTKNEVGKNRSASEDRCLREIGRLVSDLRDAHVRLQTLIQLRDDADQQFPRIEELLSMERESFSAAFAGWQKQAIPKLKSAGERLLKWPLAGITWKQICGVAAILPSFSPAWTRNAEIKPSTMNSCSCKSSSGNGANDYIAMRSSLGDAFTRSHPRLLPSESRSLSTTGSRD